MTAVIAGGATAGTVYSQRRARWTARASLASYRALSRARPLVRLIPRRVRTAMREFLLGRRETKPVRLRDDAN